MRKPPLYAHNVAGIDTGGFHPDQNVAGLGDGHRHIADLQIADCPMPLDVESLHASPLRSLLKGCATFFRAEASLLLAFTVSLDCDSAHRLRLAGCGRCRDEHCSLAPLDLCHASGSVALPCAA